MKSPRAFTLIELLIVIAIIGILMALLFPAVNAALDTAKKAQAKNDVTQIATAVIAYETEYGKLPLTNSGPVDLTSANLDPLLGVTTNGNPRKIVFIEVNTAKRGKSGTNSTGFVDPWGVLYKIAVDDNYDNSLTSVGTNAETIRKKVAVWNVPNSQTNSTAAQKKRRYVVSWE